MLIRENKTMIDRKLLFDPTFSFLPSTGLESVFLLVSFTRNVSGKTANLNMKLTKKGNRTPKESAIIPPMNGATVEPTSQDMFVQL